MRREDVIARLKQTEPALRSFGVAALYLFGSHARDDAAFESDVDVFVDPASDKDFGFLPFMDAYEALQTAFNHQVEIGYSTRMGLSPLHSEGCGTRSPADFLMAVGKGPRARLFHIRDEIEGVAVIIKGLSFEAYQASYIHRRAIERAAQIVSGRRGCRLTFWFGMVTLRGSPSSGSETFCGTSTSALRTGNFRKLRQFTCPLWSLSCGE
jgi:uncharacterized protein